MDCSHGEMKYIAKNGAKGPWRGFFCPTEKGTEGQCAPTFLKDGDPAPDGSQTASEAVYGAHGGGAGQTASGGAQAIMEAIETTNAMLADILTELRKNV